MFAGHINMLGGPHVARGPDVAHACFSRYWLLVVVQKLQYVLEVVIGSKIYVDKRMYNEFDRSKRTTKQNRFYGSNALALKIVIYKYALLYSFSIVKDHDQKSEMNHKSYEFLNRKNFFIESL